MKPVWAAVFCFLLIFSCQKEEAARTESPPQQQSADDCESMQLTDNIIGGSRVVPTDADAKSTVMIIATERNSGQSFVCTATPITSRTLITAAHCLDRAAKVMAVFHPDLLCSSGFKFSRDTIKAVSYKYHPNYDPNVMNSSNPDIGLVHLAADIKEGYPVYKISNNPEVLQSELLLYGYGITGSNNSDSTVLRKVTLDRAKYDFAEKSIVIPENGKKGICLGDSGGPGLVKNQDQLEIATINSFGYGPRNDVCGGTSSLILVYPFISWVNETLNGWGEASR